MSFLSLLPRLFYLDKSIWDWRPYQTLLTTYWFNREGIDMLNYQTPLFGFPWQVPFEYPLYQAAVAWLSGFSPFSDLVFTSRIVSLTAFYLSAFALLILVLEYTRDKLVTIVVIFVYLWHPYNIFYSTEILIDFTSVTFALFYIYSFIKWTNSPRQWWWGVFGVITGVIGALVKITTMGIGVIPIVIITLKLLAKQGLFLQRSLSSFLKWVHKRQFFLCGILIFLLIPILVSLLWTWHADGIKATNPLTVWLTSNNLQPWIFGTWEQKTSTDYWLHRILFLTDSILFDVVLIFPILGGILLRKTSKELSKLFVISFFGIFFTVFTFFNLFRHEYYWIALSPYACILIGLGMSACIRFALKKKWFWVLVISLVFIFTGARSIERTKEYQTEYLSQTEYWSSLFGELGETIKSNISEEEHIIAIQPDWFPHFVYLSERKAMIISPQSLPDFTCDMVKVETYQAVVLVDKNLTDVLEKVLSCYSKVELYSPQVFMVSSP